ncbi:MAG: enolase C-terminal domain-like protein, partial [Solirubrobacteraceae bacterium]
ESQYAILKKIRQDFSADQIEIRVDANGALDKINSLTILNQLAELKIHSIEQPIKQGQFIEMKELCKISPISIALDEELIGVFSLKKKKELLLFINPQYIILKPSLIGGFKGSEEWINLANELKIKWWVTSALESNVGLNAIAQWTYTLNNTLPQGLGTGSLFSNNFPTSLNLVGEKLFYNP